MTIDEADRLKSKHPGCEVLEVKYPHYSRYVAFEASGREIEIYCLDKPNPPPPWPAN